MNYKDSLQDLLYAQGIGRAAGRGKPARLGIGLAALMLVTLVAYLALSGPAVVAHAAPPDTHTEYAVLAANPELLFARRYYNVGTHADVEAAFVVANPEVMLARRYSPPVMNVGGQAAFLANNPELMVARRYTAAVQAGAAFLAANPELMVARRYTAAVQSDAAFLAANPELIIARR